MNDRSSSDIVDSHNDPARPAAGPPFGPLTDEEMRSNPYASYDRVVATIAAERDALAAELAATEDKLTDCQVDRDEEMLRADRAERELDAARARIDLLEAVASAARVARGWQTSGGTGMTQWIEAEDVLVALAQLDAGDLADPAPAAEEEPS